MTAPEATAIPLYCAKLLAMGFCIFPVRERDKSPLTSHGLKDASRDVDQIAAWSRQWPSCNWGIALGKQSGCCVFDFDTKDGVTNFEQKHGKFPATYTVKTGRGTHLYFQLPDGGMQTRRFQGSELRSDGAYVVGQGSIHQSGAMYECVANVPIAEFPRALLEHVKATSTIEVRPSKCIPEGERNESLFHIAIGAARNGAMEVGVLQLLRAENSRCVPPLQEHELERIAKSAVEFIARAKVESAASSSQSAPQGAPETIDGHALLDSIKVFIRRFVSLSEFQARTVAVWVIHTYLTHIADSTPYLTITSAEKQSGKTRLLEVLETVVANPWSTGRVTAAVLWRKIDAEKPTLLLDESDAAFGSEKEYAEALRGVLNTGHRQGGKASCCVGQGANFTFRDFSTFCAKAIAGIGKLPGTVEDRAIPIRLKRAAGQERPERFRYRNVKTEAERLKGQIATWCKANASTLTDAHPALSEELTDRQQDACEPLIAIADAAGGDWPEALRQALVRLCCAAQLSDTSTGVQLLADIRQLFDARGFDRIVSAELVSELAKIETSPWSEWSNRKPLSPTGLASLLKPFEIGPHNIRTENGVLRGYERDDFEDSWTRYLRSFQASSLRSQKESATAATVFVPNQIGQVENATREASVATQKTPEPTTDVGCSDVALSEPEPTSNGVVEVEI